MRLLGVDYGTKRIGLAVGSTESRLAQPYAVIFAGKKAVSQVAEICQKEEVVKIVIGRSVNYRRADNPVVEDSLVFVRALSEATGLPVVWEDETLTTKAAERLIGRDEKTDARAAALILSGFLDKHYGNI